MKAPRSGAWAPLVLALIALAVSVVEFPLGERTGYLVSTIGLVAIGTGVVALRKIRQGFRGSAAVASLAIGIGALATVVMILRFVLGTFLPAVLDQLPFVTVPPPDSSQFEVVATAPDLGLQNDLGTLVYLIDNGSVVGELGETTLVNGVIVLPDGQVLQAPEVAELRITVNRAGDNYAITLLDATGKSAHYSSRTRVITSD